MSMFQVAKRQDAKPKQLRKQGMLPMALVERTHETVLIQAPVAQLREAMGRLDSHGRMEFQMEGSSATRRAIVKHIEQDVLRHELIHVTLQEVADDDLVKMDVPVVASGHADLGEGVSLTPITDHLKVRGKMSAIPERIEVDVTNLAVGDHVAASDICLPEGVDLLSPADATLFTVSIIREEPAEMGLTEEEAPAEVPATEA